MTNNVKNAAIQDYMLRRSVDASLKQAAVIGLAFGLAYVIVTIGLRGYWDAMVGAHMRGADLLSGEEPGPIAAQTMEAYRNLPTMPTLLKLLIQLIPATHLRESGGLIANWPILLQGLWLGVLMFLNICMLSRGNLPKVISTIWPIFALYLVPFLFAWALTGSFGRSLVVGFVGLIVGNIPGALVTLWVFLRNKYTQQKV